MRGCASPTFPLIKVSALFIAALCVLCLWPASAGATPAADEVQAEADAAYAQLVVLQNKLDEASNTYFAALEEQQKAQQRMAEAQANIDAASARIDELQEKLTGRVRTMYRSGTISLLDIVLGASTFREFANELSLYNQMNQNDATLVGESKALRSALEQERDIFAAQERVAAESAEQARSVKDEAEGLAASMQETYSNLSAEAAEIVEAERAAAEALEAASAGDVLAQNASSANEYYESAGDGSYSEPEYVAETGNAVVDRAYSYLGNAEYVWGACSPGAFDCSGFVSYCLCGQYTRLGTTYTFLDWPQVSDPQPGDVAVNAAHCGIYIGGGQIIHCTSYGGTVIIGPVQSGMTFHRW